MYLGRLKHKTDIISIKNSLIDIFWIVYYFYLLKYLNFPHPSPWRGMCALCLSSWMTLTQKCRPPDLPAATLRWCQLSLCGPILVPFSSINRIYNAMFFKHLSVSLIQPVNCLWASPFPSLKWSQRTKKWAVSVTKTGIWSKGMGQRSQQCFKHTVYQ